VPEYLDYWARIKGITIIGTGDFTHPGWLAELKEKLEPAEDGLYKLKDNLRIKNPGMPETPVRFMLTAEISNIYKKHDRVRKVHNVIFAPDFKTAEKIQSELSIIGNITSDGRPILGMDARDLLEIALAANDKIFFVPAHIWTPWFSALGSKSGFDSIQECYDDLAGHIYGVETGLSTDPPMNWMCSFLDSCTLLSNSDAHSPEKLGRNANIFNTELSYHAVINAIKSADEGRFLGTIDLYPQEGKYHYDGHRKCGICWDPLQTLKNNAVCPVCSKKVTVGVMNRVVQLADRDNLTERPGRRPYYSIIPLKEILSEMSGKGENTKHVTQLYNILIQKAGSEFNILLHRPLEELSRHINPALLEAVRRMRSGEVFIKEGFDGQFGEVKAFTESENKGSLINSGLFAGEVREKGVSYNARGLVNFDLAEFLRLHKNQEEADTSKQQEAEKDDKVFFSLNVQQHNAVSHFRGPALIIAGPGTGKTRVLTYRTAWLIKEKHVQPENILAVTFTNKAAAEISERLEKLLPAEAGKSPAAVCTFHSLGLKVLKENQADDFSIIDEKERIQILQKHINMTAGDAAGFSKQISSIKQKILPEERLSENDNESFSAYQDFLLRNNLLDLDDLIYKAVLLFEENEEILQKYRQTFQWILVDEFQDINAVQYQLVRMLADSPDANTCAVGDPDQAIYGFRGADVSFMQRFLDDYSGAELFRLQKSYRCSQKILQASQNVLKSYDPALSGINEGVKIEIVYEKTDRSEAEFTARTIEKMIGGLQFFSMDSGITQGDKGSKIESLSDFAILCRLKQQMPVYEKALKDHRIPYQKISDQSFFSKEIISQVMDLLQLVYQPQNRYLQEKLIGLNIITREQAESLEQRVSGKSTASSRLEVLVKDFFTGRKKLQDEDKKKLLSIAGSYGMDGQSFLQDAALHKGIDAHKRDVEKVSLMTIHAAKGLEFKCVFIGGCEEGLLPYTMFNKDENTAEENRLLYVGMTRAEKYLFLSHADKRYLFGRDWTLPRSSFLDKIEDDLLKLSKSEFRKKVKPQDNQLSLF